MERNLSCEYCKVSSLTPTQWLLHVSGTAHRELLAQVAPGELQHFSRLQCFMDRYMKDYPILGLEYVEEERQADSSYMYSCLLCNWKKAVQGMVYHITDLDHMRTYVLKHHRHMVDIARFPRTRKYMEYLAGQICTLYGRKEIRVKQPGVYSAGTATGSSPNEGDKQNGSLPSTRDNLQTQSVKERMLNNSGGEQEEGLMGSSQRLDNKKVQGTLVCNLCNVRILKVTYMYDHVRGKKHYSKLLCSAPEELKELGSLSYFLRKHFKEEPILGLEYISEWKEGSVYTFFCELCTMQSNLRNMISHIMDVDHMERYIFRHHAQFLTGVVKVPGMYNYRYTLRDIAVKILEKDGRKAIKLQNPTVAGPTKFPGGGSETSKDFKDKEGEAHPPSIHDSGNTSHAKRKTSPQWELGPEEMLKKPKINDPSLEKDRLLPEHDQDALPSSTCISEDSDPCTLNMAETAMVDLTTAKQDVFSSRTRIPVDSHLHLCSEEAIARRNCSTAEQELKFRTNYQLLEYLANFVIDDQEDASFIQKITQNCIKALIGFQEIEAKKLKSSCQP